MDNHNTCILADHKYNQLPKTLINSKLQTTKHQQHANHPLAIQGPLYFRTEASFYITMVLIHNESCHPFQVFQRFVSIHFLQFLVCLLLKVFLPRTLSEKLGISSAIPGCSILSKKQKETSTVNIYSQLIQNYMAILNGQDH